MRDKGLSASRIGQTHLVINAIFNEAVRDKKLHSSPCQEIELPPVVLAKDFVLASHLQLEVLVTGLPADWATTVWLMHGCGLRIGEALAVNTRCRIENGTLLRVTEQVNPRAQLVPLKFRKDGDHRDIPLPEYVNEAIDLHIAQHGTTADGYLFQGRLQKLVVRNSYQQNFRRAVRKADLPGQFVPHSLRHHFASVALAEGIPITDVSRWLGHKTIEITYRIYGHLVPEAAGRARKILDEAYQAARTRGDEARQAYPGESAEAHSPAC